MAVGEGAVQLGSKDLLGHCSRVGESLRLREEDIQSG